MPVNERWQSLINAGLSDHQLFTHSPGTKRHQRGCHGTVLTALPVSRAQRRPSFARAVALFVVSLSPATASRNPTRSMPHYFFHFRVEGSLFKDEDGEVLADASLALQHARRIAAELVHGGESTNAAIVVVEDGQQLFEVRLSECGD
jgi:hypothetical protein